MKRIGIIIFLCFILYSPLMAGELYIWTDGNGRKQITDRPPENPAKIIGIETYKRDSPEEIQRYQAGQKAKEQRRDAELRQEQQVNQQKEEARQQRESERRIGQDARDRRADQLKAVVGAVTSDMPSSQRRGFEEAARLKAEQIKAGTDTPISPSEDMRFHVEQEVRWQLEQDRILRPNK